MQASVLRLGRPTEGAASALFTAQQRYSIS